MDIAEQAEKALKENPGLLELCNHWHNSIALRTYAVAPGYFRSKEAQLMVDYGLMTKGEVLPDGAQIITYTPVAAYIAEKAGFNLGSRWN